MPTLYPFSNAMKNMAKQISKLSTVTEASKMKLLLYLEELITNLLAGKFCGRIQFILNLVVLVSIS